MTAQPWFIPDQRTHALPPGVDVFALGRESWWSWEQLDFSERTVGELGNDGGTGIVADDSGEVSHVLGREVRGEGKLEWQGLAADQPEWSTMKVRPWYHARFADGSTWSQPMGLFVCATPRASHASGLVTVPVDLYDKTLLLARDRAEEAVSLPAGTPIVEAVQELILAATGDRVAIDPGEETLRSQMTWEQGTSVLRRVNDLLQAGPYFALHSDMMGALTAARYVRPEDREVVAHFVDGDSATYEDAFTLTNDDFDTPNKVILTSRPAADTDEVLTAVATVDEVYGTRHRLSRARRGFWQTPEGIDVVDATDQAALDVMARQRLADGLERAVTLPLAVFPTRLQPNDIARFTSSSARLAFLGAVQSVTAPTQPDAWWDITLRRLASSDMAHLDDEGDNQ